MIDYQKIYEDSIIVRYRYRVWGKGDGGIVEFDKEKKCITYVQRAKEDGIGRYSGHLMSTIHKMSRTDTYEQSGSVAWA